MRKKACGGFQHFKKAFASVLVATLAFSMLSSARNVKADTSLGGPGRNGRKSTYNYGYNTGKTLQPTAPTFDMFNILDWKPEDDPDGEINRSKVPLNKEVYKGHEVNPKATKEAGILNCSISNWSHDDGSSVGYDDFNFYAFDYWQYLDAYIYWSGSKHGLITVPAPDIVDAAHREGVPVHAMFGFPWGGGAEGPRQLRQLYRQDPDGSYPVMQKLIDVAKHYGFDGYFYNQESYDVTKEDAEKLKAAMLWFKKKAPELTISWYDSMDPEGSVHYQNALNDANKWWMEADADGTRAIDWMFLNYNYGKYRIDISEKTAKSIGISPYQVYAGLEVQQRSYKTDRLPTDAFPGPDGKSRVSIALFAANSTMGMAKDPADFHNHENIFYVGVNGDPTSSDDTDKLPDGSRWRGMSRFIGDRTAITSLPFYTDFNSSHGKKFFRNGEEVRDEGWNSRFLQKTTPTWRWWIRDTAGNPLKGSYDFDCAYNGGNSMKLSGKLLPGSKQDIMLYSTKLENVSEAKALVTYKASPGAKIYLGIGTDKEYKAEGIKKVLLKSATGEWQKSVVRLQKFVKPEDTVYSLSLHVESESGVEDYNLNLGEMGIYHERVKPGEVFGQTVDDSIIHSAIEAEARISWAPARDAAYYEVYQDKGDGKAVFVNGTTNHVFYTANLRRVPNAEGTHSNIYIVPVSKDGTRGEPAILHFPWNMKADATPSAKEEKQVNVCLGAKVTGKSGEGDGEPATKAIDGQTMGNSKWCDVAPSGWMSIKLDKERTIRRIRIEHAEAGGEAKDMNTGAFHLEYKNGDRWERAERIDASAPEAITDINLAEPVTASEFKLVITRSASGSPWGAVRIYEWQMFETTQELSKHIPRTSATLSVDGKKAVFKGVPADTTVKLFAGKESTEVLAEMKNVKTTDSDLVFEGLPVEKIVDGTLFYETQSGHLKPSVRLNVIDLSKYTVLQDQTDFVPPMKGDIEVGQYEEIGAPVNPGLIAEEGSLPPVPVPEEKEKEEKKPEEAKPEEKPDKDAEDKTEESKKEPEAEVKKGDRNTTNGLTYEVSSVKSGTAKLVVAESKAKKIVLPDTIMIGNEQYKVTSIGADVLKKAKNLETLTIGKYVRTIGKNAFRYNKKLKLIIFKGDRIEKISKSAFRGLDEKTKIRFPKKMKKSKIERLKKMMMK